MSTNVRPDAAASACSSSSAAPTTAGKSKAAKKARVTSYVFDLVEEGKADPAASSLVGLQQLDFLTYQPSGKDRRDKGKVTVRRGDMLSCGFSEAVVDLPRTFRRNRRRQPPLSDWAHESAPR